MTKNYLNKPQKFLTHAGPDAKSVDIRFVSDLLQQTRNDALEEAAEVAESFCDKHVDGPVTMYTSTGANPFQISNAIRSLKKEVG